MVKLLNFRFLSSDTETLIRKLAGKFFGIGKKKSYTQFLTEAIGFIDSHQEEFDKWMKSKKSMKFIEKDQGLPIN